MYQDNRALKPENVFLAVVYKKKNARINYLHEGRFSAAPNGTKFFGNRDGTGRMRIHPAEKLQDRFHLSEEIPEALK